MNEPSPGDLLSEIERDRLAVYVRNERRPRWVPPFFGLATFVLFAAYDLDVHPIVPALVAIVYAAAVGAVAGHLLAASGMAPRLRSMPSELRTPLILFGAVAATVNVGSMVTGFILDIPGLFTALGIVAGLTLGGGGWITMRVYDARARRLADAAGITAGSS